MEDQGKGAIHSFETFGSVDGPGVRFVVFLQGCKMRCQFCHNPDTWKTDSQTLYFADEIIKKALRYRSYWGKDGGISFSGGEPLLQMDFLLAVCKKAKELGIHIVIDTCGQPYTREEPFFSKFQELLNYVDLFLLDIKHIDNDKHRELTKWENQNILQMATFLSQQHKPIWLRHVLVPGINDGDDDFTRLDAFVKTLSNVHRFEILPYHTLGIYKWKELGLSYALDAVEPPNEKQIEHANKLLHTASYDRYTK